MSLFPPWSILFLSFAVFLFKKTQFESSFFAAYAHLQVKSRMVEAAGCGAVMLVFNDGYNVIEQYYEPGVDFVYWTAQTGPRLLVLAVPGGCVGVAYPPCAILARLLSWVTLATV